MRRSRIVQIRDVFAYKISHSLLVQGKQPPSFAALTNDL